MLSGVSGGQQTEGGERGSMAEWGFAGHEQGPPRERRVQWDVCCRRAYTLLGGCPWGEAAAERGRGSGLGWQAIGGSGAAQ